MIDTSNLGLRNILILGMGLAVGILLGVGVFLDPRWLWTQRTDRSVPQEAPALANGHPAPDFALESLTRETLRLSDPSTRLRQSGQALRGHPILINFWATWCGPCRQEMPLLQKYYRENQPDLVVLAVNAGEDRSVVKAFVDEFGLTFDVLLDPDGRVQALYNIRGYPTTFFLDVSGTIQAVWVGPLDETGLPGYLGKIGIGP